MEIHIHNPDGNQTTCHGSVAKDRYKLPTMPEIEPLQGESSVIFKSIHEMKEMAHPVLAKAFLEATWLHATLWPRPQPNGHHHVPGEQKVVAC